MTTRVLLKGHDEVSLEGENFKPNDLGVFEVPDHLAHILIEQHGGTTAANVLNAAEQQARDEASAKAKEIDDQIKAEAEAEAKAQAEAEEETKSKRSRR